LQLDHQFEELFPSFERTEYTDLETFNEQKLTLEVLLNQESEEHHEEGGCDQEPRHYIYKWWHKLEKDLMLKNGTYDVSKIPDIYDMLKFDMLHNFIIVGEIGHSLFEKVA